MNIIILIAQISSLAIYIIILINYTIKRIKDSKRKYKIESKDQHKFKYYRDIIKEYSIGELGYIFNGRKKTKLLIIAELEKLKLQKNIEIINGEIKITNSKNTTPSEKFILENYKFINEKDFEKRYISIIEDYLIKKHIIEKFDKNISSKMLPMLFVVFILLITSMYFNLDEYIKIELILFLITWITVFISMIIFEHEEKIIKNNQGNEIYMKLNGLKKYIKDFGNFEERELDEINIWEEYILYAIILNEGKTIKNESKTELQSLIEIIYK